MKNDVTYLGSVIRVDSGIVEVEISNDIPSAAPIIDGRLYKIGQIGTFVKLPIGNVVLFGIVSSVSNAPSKLTDEDRRHDYGSRFLTVQLVGELLGDEGFEKGIGTYPTINDEVHLVVEADLQQIYGSREAGSIDIGAHSSSDNLRVYVDLHRMVLRHSAILGSTGSGKSNTTVSILKSILGTCPGSRILLVDPHGEYSSAFPGARVFKIGDSDCPLYIPFWLMNFEELALFLVGASPKEEQASAYKAFREKIVAYKRTNSQALGSGEVESNFVTADSPIPFNVRELWLEMNWWLNATFESKNEQTKENACQIDPGQAADLRPATFRPYSMGSAAPFKSTDQVFFAYEKNLFVRLLDSRYDFLFSPGPYQDVTSGSDLSDLLNLWIGNEERLTILDLNGVPPDVLDLVVGLITRFLFDSMFWGRFESYTGKARPLLMAFEEAHAYLNKNTTQSYAREAVERVFKEGRKFGLGAMVISQRPSEISPTILAQIGTYIALRLTNSSDQSIVKSSAPDNLVSLIDLLPSLRVGEAIVVGEAIKIPSRVRIELNYPRPASEDPDLVRGWGSMPARTADDYKAVVRALRMRKLGG